MMKTIARSLTIVAALAATSAWPAQPDGIVSMHNGAVLRLKATQAPPCIGESKNAEWVSADATKRIAGCWRALPEHVRVVYMDGDISRIPYDEVKIGADL